MYLVQKNIIFPSFNFSKGSNILDNGVDKVLVRGRLVNFLVEHCRGYLFALAADEVNGKEKVNQFLDTTLEMVVAEMSDLICYHNYDFDAAWSEVIGGDYFVSVLDKADQVDDKPDFSYDLYDFLKGDDDEF